MFTIIISALIVADRIPPPSQSEFLQAARFCGMEVDPTPDGLRRAEGWYFPQSWRLDLLSNQPKDSRTCMEVWARRHKIMVVLVRL